MKRFEFSLRRVLDLRRQQASIEQVRLQGLVKTLNRVLAAKDHLKQELEAARAAVRQSGASGDDYRNFSEYERHVHRRNGALERDAQLVRQQVQAQQVKTREAERQVKMLENLETKKRADWQRQADKELEDLAADSYMARLSADRRRNDAALIAPHEPFRQLD